MSCKTFHQLPSHFITHFFKEEPSFDDDYVSTGDDREVVVGGGARVYSCAASGIPEPDIRWYYNGGRDLGSGVEISADGGTLTIADPQIANSGIYQCMVSNLYGVVSRRWVLEVREPSTYVYVCTCVCMYPCCVCVCQ